MDWKALVALSLLAASLPGKQALAQKPAPGFVALPNDISCSLQNMTAFFKLGQNGQVQFAGTPTAQGVTCWLSGKNPGEQKPIALTATTIHDGMLPTKEFGDLQIAPTQDTSPSNTSLFIAIRREKLRPLREYLQK